MKKMMNERVINKESRIYKDIIKKGKECMKMDEKWIEKGYGYRKRIVNRGGWSLFKNGVLWRDGFDSEVNVWRSLIGGISMFVNMWDYGWEIVKKENIDLDSKRVYDYMIGLGKECGVKIRVNKFERGGFVKIDKKDYYRLRKEVSEDLGWEIKYIE